MIFKIDNNLFIQYTPVDIAELLSAMIKNNHYIACANNRIYEKITENIKNHASSRVNELMTVYRRFSIDEYHRDLLTEIDTNNFTYQQLMILAEKPAVLLPENTREWKVYTHIIKAYTADVKVREVALTLLEAVNNRTFITKQIGGNGEMKTQIESLAQQEYDGATISWKCCVIIDRDVEADYDATGKWKLNTTMDNLFRYLSTKDSTSLSHSDIYSVSQPTFHWHMWYKRMIENYFPDNAYLHIGCDLTIFNTLKEVRDYRKISGKTIRGYKKDDIGRLTEVMGWRDYNRGLVQFPHNGVMYTELELLLFKMCKII